MKRMLKCFSTNENRIIASFLKSEIHKKCALLEEALKLCIPVQFYKAKKVRTGAHLKFFSKKNSRPSKNAKKCKNSKNIEVFKLEL